MAGHELPGGGVEGDQVEVGPQQQQHRQREQGHRRGRRQQHAVGAQPRLPRVRRTEARPGGEGTGPQGAPFVQCFFFRHKNLRSPVCLVTCRMFLFLF